MQDNKLFEEICKIETTLKCNYVDEVLNFIDILGWAKLVNPELYAKLVEMYKVYYSEENKFWV